MSVLTQKSWNRFGWAGIFTGDMTTTTNFREALQIPPGARIEATLMPPTFDELYRDRYRPMIRLAYVLVDTTEDAEHVVQDAFVALYKRFDRVDRPDAYLRTSVINGARKMLRRRRIMRRTPGELERPGELGFDHTFDAIRRLPPHQRSVIALRYEQQLTDSEIAETLSMPIGTVKSRLHRALTTLRQELT